MVSKTECETPRRPYIVGLNAIAGLAVLFRPRCKKWDCPACAPINRAKWCVRAYQGSQKLIREGRSISFVTLTSHPALGPDGSVAVLRSAWDMLNKRVHRIEPFVSYIMIPERHKDGRVHVHMLTTSILEKRWWKDNGAECGFGYMADREPLCSPEGAAWYVSKYTTKSLEGEKWPKGFRRVRTSQNFPKLTKLPSPPDWSFMLLPKDASINGYVERLSASGYRIVEAGANEAWSVIIPDDNRQGE
jgi:hypothetical protein